MHGPRCLNSIGSLLVVLPCRIPSQVLSVARQEASAAVSALAQRQAEEASREVSRRSRLEAFAAA
eukprot:4275429-Pleurochrysis_carterae.AAC.2